MIIYLIFLTSLINNNIFWDLTTSIDFEINFDLTDECVLLTFQTNQKLCLDSFLLLQLDMPKKPSLLFLSVTFDSLTVFWNLGSITCQFNSHNRPSVRAGATGAGTPSSL